MNGRVYLSPPDVGPAEEAALIRALRSGWVAPLGPDVDAFEGELAERTGRKYCVALSSGTAALHLALLGVGAGPGDVVMTPTMTFAATANAVTYTGATPVFVDCDESGCVSPRLLSMALESQHSRGASIKAVLVVDLMGKVADYASIERIASSYGIPVIADAAESLGARRDDRPAGGFGVAAAVSFNGNKVMTTSGGGALLTDEARMANRCRYLAAQARQPAVHYEHTEVGFNYRLSNLLAALGRAQLARLDDMIECRRQMRLLYRELFAGVIGVRIFENENDESGQSNYENFWLTSILVNTTIAGWSPADLIEHLARTEIEARPLWKPMHAQPVYERALAYLDGTSDALFAQGISLPSGSGMDQATRRRVLLAVDEFLGARGST